MKYSGFTEYSQLIREGKEEEEDDDHHDVKHIEDEIIGFIIFLKERIILLLPRKDILML
jgi:hypothetical protein